MSLHKSCYAGTFIVSLAMLLLWPGVAAAYIGPGAGLELVPYALGLLAWMLTIFSTVLLWPVYTVIRWLRGSKDKSATESSTGPEGGGAVTAEGRRDGEQANS